MSLHEKRYNPNGKLVVAKADGMRFGGRTYHQGEAITDPTLTMRKARQLYFQNKLCYDYELSAKAEEIAEARHARELAAARAEQDRLASESAAAVQAEQDRIDFELRAAAHAVEVARAQRAADEASGRVPATPAEAVSEAPVVVVENVGEAALVIEPVVVIEQPAVAVEAPRRRRASAPAGDTSVPEADAPSSDTLVGDGIGAIQ